MKKKIGIVLIIVALLFALHPFGVLPAIPVYIIGVFLIWFSNASKKRKLSLTIFPLIIYVPLLMLTMYLAINIRTALAQKLEFRFNEDFRGLVTIVYPVEWGQKVTIENGREIIDVPQDGILYYQGKIDPKGGYTNWKYVSISALGEVKDLSEFRLWELTDSEKELIKSDSIGVIEGGGWSRASYQPEPMVEFNTIFLWLNEWDKLNTEIDNFNKDSLSKIIESELRKNKTLHNKTYKQ